MSENYTENGKAKVTKPGMGRLINFWISTNDEKELALVCKTMRRSRSNTLRQLVHQEFEIITKSK
jgi:hypothetical protein